MKKLIVVASAASLLALTGCYAQPYPYYGGQAPYYGTTYQPPYAYGDVGVGFYPSYGYHHVYSNYHTGYWHHQYAAHASGGGSHGGGFHGGHDGHH